MKTFITALLLALGIHRAPAPFLSNVMTTNDTPTTLNLVTNIANAAAAATQGASLSQSTNIANNIYSNNAAGYITSTATNHITKLDTNVVTSIVGSTGITVSSSLDSGGYHYTISATGTNQVSVTNLNATVIANAGGLTTNNFGTYADAAGAALNATNGFPWGSLYDGIGAALNATNRGNIRFTNALVIGSILLSSNMTVSYTTNSQNIVTATIGSIASASGTFQPAATNLYGWAGLSTNQVVIGTNTIGQLIGGTNILLTATTNAGAVSVTVNALPDPLAQRGSQNLTNWANVPTNSFVFSTNLVAKITAGTAVTVSATTNNGSINYTVNSTATPTTMRAGSFTAVAGGSGSVVFSSTMGSAPVVTLGQTDWGASATGRGFVIILSTSATGFSWSDANDTSGLNKTIYYIAVLPQ